MSSDSADRVDGIAVDASLDALLRRLRRVIELELRVSMPARIVTFVPGSPGPPPVRPSATVRLELLQIADVRGEEIPNPPDIITMIPVEYPGASTGGVTFPLLPGDTGRCVFTDRALAAWLQTGNPVAPVDPESGRTHNLGDAVFVPGLKTDADAIAAGPVDMTATVLDGAALVKIGAGAADFAAQANVLVSAIDAALAAASLAVVPTDGGAASFTAFTTAWNAAKGSIAATKAMVE